MEAEKAVIGSVLLNGQAEDLDVSDFDNPKLATIWEAIQAVDVIDMTTVATKLHEWKKLGQVGGAEYIAELMNIVPTGSHSKKYAESVSNESTRRKLESLLSRDLDSSKTNEENIGEIMSELQAITKPTENRSMTELLIEFDRIKKEGITGLLTGFKWLDEKVGGVGAGMFWCIVARSFVGKTTFALQMARNICDTTGKKAVLYTLEQSDINVLRTLERVQKQKKQEIDQFTMMRLDIIDSLRRWESIAIDAQKREADVIIVDYAQMVGIKGGAIYEKMENLAFAIRGFTNKTKIPVILISQISEESRKTPSAHDAAKGGSALFDAADVFINLRGDEKKEEEQRLEDARTGGNPAFGGKTFERLVIVAKNKYGQPGGKYVSFNYEDGYGTYTVF